MRRTLWVDVHLQASTERMRGDNGFRFCTYTCTDLPHVPHFCHFSTYYSFPEKKSVPELNDQPSYMLSSTKSRPFQNLHISSRFKNQPCSGTNFSSTSEGQVADILALQMGLFLIVCCSGIVSHKYSLEVLEWTHKSYHTLFSRNSLSPLLWRKCHDILDTSHYAVSLSIL